MKNSAQRLVGTVATAAVVALALSACGAGRTDDDATSGAAAETVCTCILREGLTFANGNPINASTVKLSFDRQIVIANPNRPSSLLTNLASVEAVDDTTVAFTLKGANDQTFPQILAYPADEKSFPAVALLADDGIVTTEAFTGPCSISSYKKNELVAFTKNADYSGIQGAAKNDGITLKYDATRTT